MAEAAKSRARKNYEYQPGEHVWVETTFFDDVRVPLEERYSTIVGGDGRSIGIVLKKIGGSYSIQFEDCSITSVPQARLHSIPKAASTTIMQEDDDDEDWVPDDMSYSDESDVLDEQTLNVEPSSSTNTSTAATSASATLNAENPMLKDKEEVSLCHLGKDVFKGTFSATEDKFVHGKELDKFHGRFFITKVLKDAGKWKNFDADVHIVGAPVMWKLSSINRMMRTPFSQLGTEATNATPLAARKRKKNPDNWNTTKRKNAVNLGEKFIWKKRNGEEKVHGRERKVDLEKRCSDSCKKECKNVSDEERKMIHKGFWKMGSHQLQRGFILTHVKQQPKERERKGERSKHNYCCF